MISNKRTMRPELWRNAFPVILLALAEHCPCATRSTSMGSSSPQTWRQTGATSSLQLAGGSRGTRTSSRTTRSCTRASRDSGARVPVGQVTSWGLLHQNTNQLTTDYQRQQSNLKLK